MLMLPVFVLVLGLVASFVWEVKADAAEEPRRTLRHRLVEDVQEIHERFGDFLNGGADILTDNLAAFTEAEIHLRNNAEKVQHDKLLNTKKGAYHQVEDNKLAEMHKQFEEPIFSLPFSIIPNAAIEGWADLDNNLPPVLSGMSFPFADEDVHRFNHIGNLDHDGHHSTAITSTLSTSTQSDNGALGLLGVQAAAQHPLEAASPKCIPLSWMHEKDHHPPEAASPKCLPLSWMHEKERPSEKAHAAHAEVLDLLPPFSLPFSLPLDQGEGLELQEFHSPPVAMQEQHISAEPTMVGPDCDCVPGFGRDCCHLPPFTCNPGKIDCKDPWYLPLPPVCGCDGRTYANFCEALFENCVKCWEPGPCPMSYY